MNRRIIKSIISRKFKSWVESLKDEKLKEMVKKNTIVTGGCIPSMLVKEKVNDFDIYFRNKETVFAIAKYYVKWFKELHKEDPKNRKTRDFHVYYDEEDASRIRIMIKSAGVIGENTYESQYRYFENRPLEEGEEYVETSLNENLEGADELDGTVFDDDKKTKYRPVFMTDNAITLSHKIQIIIRFYGEPDEIHKNYDFIHCTNYWSSWNNNLVLHQGALESLIAKQLYYIGSKYPICSAIRMRKFIKKGWHINAGQILKICMQISELNLDNIKILEDQLTGVDTAYFMQLIDYLKEERDKNEGFQITMPYLASLIDKIF